MNEDIEMIQLESDHLDQIGYDESTETLYVDFVDGSSYSYSGVPMSAFEGLQDASSHSENFRTRIKGHYSYRKEG